MKSRVLIPRAMLFCLVALTSLSYGNAQSFETEMYDPSTLLGTPSTTLEHRGILRNLSASPKNVVVRYFNELTHPDHAPSMCTAELCYELPNSFLEPQYDLPVFTLAAGDSIALKALLNPVGYDGTSTLIFRIFDQENPADSVRYQMTFSISAANTVGDLLALADVVVAPNPTSDRVNISAPILTQATSLDVYATDGQLLSTQRHDGSQLSTVNVSTLPAGSYHIVVTLASGVIYRTPISVIR